MDRIGIRELRQHASRYVRRVKAGESLEITDRGVGVALLVPKSVDRWEEMISSGQVIPPATGHQRPGTEPPIESDFHASAELQAQRDLDTY